MFFKNPRCAGKTSTSVVESSVSSTKINGVKDKDISPANIDKKKTISDPSVKKSALHMNPPDSSKKRKISSLKNLSEKENLVNETENLENETENVEIETYNFDD